MTKKKILNIIFVFLGLIFVLFFWEISSRIYNSNSVFPSFIESLMNLVNLLKDINLYKSLLFTIGLGLLGVLISIIFGIFFGILAYYFELFRAFFSPINKIFRVIPTIIISILLIIFIKNIFAYLIISFLVLFPLIYEATLKGFLEIDQNIINSLRLEETKGFSSLFKVLFPLASPYILLSVIQSIGLGLKIEIMAEILMGDNKNIGIGHLINNAYNHTFNYIDIYSYTLLIVVVYLLIDLVLYILKEKFIKIDK